MAATSTIQQRWASPAVFITEFSHLSGPCVRFATQLHTLDSEARFTHNSSHGEYHTNSLIISTPANKNVLNSSNGANVGAVNAATGIGSTGNTSAPPTPAHGDAPGQKAATTAGSHLHKKDLYYTKGRHSVSGNRVCPLSASSVGAVVGRAISMETPHRGTTGEILFSQAGIGGVASHLFTVEDMQARGEKRQFGVVVTHPRFQDLCCRWTVLREFMRQIAAELHDASAVVRKDEYTSCGCTVSESRKKGVGVELRSLDALLDEEIDRRLHPPASPTALQLTVASPVRLTAAPLSSTESRTDSDGNEESQDHNNTTSDFSVLHSSAKCSPLFDHLHARLELMLVSCFNSATHQPVPLSQKLPAMFEKQKQEAIADEANKRLQAAKRQQELLNTNGGDVTSSNLNSSPDATTKLIAAGECRARGSMGGCEPSTKENGTSQIKRQSNLMNSPTSPNTTHHMISATTTAAMLKEPLLIESETDQGVTTASSVCGIIQQLQPVPKFSFSDARYKNVPIASFLRDAFFVSFKCDESLFSTQISTLFSALFQGNQIMVISDSGSPSTTGIEACNSFAMALASLLPETLQRVKLGQEEYLESYACNILTFGTAFYDQYRITDERSISDVVDDDRPQFVLSELDPNGGIVCVSLSEPQDDASEQLRGAELDTVVGGKWRSRTSQRKEGLITEVKSCAELIEALEERAARERTGNATSRFPVFAADGTVGGGSNSAFSQGNNAALTNDMMREAGAFSKVDRRMDVDVLRRKAQQLTMVAKLVRDVMRCYYLCPSSFTSEVDSPDEPSCSLSQRPALSPSTSPTSSVHKSKEDLTATPACIDDEEAGGTQLPEDSPTFGVADHSMLEIEQGVIALVISEFTKTAKLYVAAFRPRATRRYTRGLLEQNLSDAATMLIPEGSTIPNPTRRKESTSIFSKVRNLFRKNSSSDSSSSRNTSGSPYRGTPLSTGSTTRDPSFPSQPHLSSLMARDDVDVGGGQKKSRRPKSSPTGGFGGPVAPTHRREGSYASPPSGSLDSFSSVSSILGDDDIDDAFHANLVSSRHLGGSDRADEQLMRTLRVGAQDHECMMFLGASRGILD